MFSWSSVWQDLSWLEQFNDWLRSIALQYGYLGIFVASFLGAVSIVIPVPYTILIVMMGKILNPIFLALSAGLGAALGEMFGYMLGYYGRAVISDERKRKVDYILKIFKRYGSLAIFIFALTPLPDDLILIPLGIMHYSFIKAFIPCFLGKIVMSLILAYGGRLSISFIEIIFGGEEGSIWAMMATTILLIAIIIVMLKVDWEKIIRLPPDVHSH
jgi:membrane protein YqaA with SNARE-associated domain